MLTRAEKVVSFFFRFQFNLNFFVSFLFFYYLALSTHTHAQHLTAMCVCVCVCLLKRIWCRFFFLFSLRSSGVAVGWDQGRCHGDDGHDGRHQLPMCFLFFFFFCLLFIYFFLLWVMKKSVIRMNFCEFSYLFFRLLRWMKLMIYIQFFLGLIRLKVMGSCVKWMMTL